MFKNGGKLKRVFSHHSSSSSSGPNNTVVSGLRRSEKVKRLNEGTMSSNVEDELIRRKFKLPKKGLCDSIPVHPASVPRKLRSAISKRSCHSASAPLMDSKRLKHSINGGVASLRKDCLKKLRTSMNVSVPISKEEEEVAETLFALAGMISPSGESSKAKTPDCARNNHDDPMSSSEDPVIRKEEQGTACNQSSSYANNVIPAADGSKKDSVQVKPMSETSSLNWPKLSERRQLNQDLKVSVLPVHLQRIPPLLRACDERQVTNSATISQLSTDTLWHRGVNDTKIEKVSFPLWQSQHFVDSQAVDRVFNQGRDPFHGIGLDGLFIKSSTIIFPSMVNGTASSSKPGTCDDIVSVDKVSSSVNGTMKSRKRCITHVYISHLIQGKEMSEGKDNRPLNACQSRPSQSSSIAPDKNDLSGALTSHMFGSTTYKNICETDGRVPINLEHREEKDDSLKKQSFDFLSLSPGVASKANRLGNCLEAKGQVPNMHSVSQASTSLPCSTPKNCFSSKACRDQVAVASLAMPPVPTQVQLQMPQYFAGTFNPAHMSQTGTAKATQIAQPTLQHQQQQIWTSQQFRSGTLLSSHIANWQNRRQDPRISTQAWHTPSQPSREMTGAKYLHVSQHQQQLIERCPPLPLSSSKPQTGQLPTVCEDKSGRFQPDGALPFQLLCNEQL